MDFKNLIKFLNREHLIDDFVPNKAIVSEKAREYISTGNEQRLEGRVYADFKSDKKLYSPSTGNAATILIYMSSRSTFVPKVRTAKTRI